MHKIVLNPRIHSKRHSTRHGNLQQILKMMPANDVTNYAMMMA